jgi:tRNA(Glu) U13 pseudouridine synthase TruD
VRILKVGRGNKLLKVGDNKGNLFFLRLRRKEIKKEISEDLPCLDSYILSNRVNNQKISDD